MRKISLPLGLAALAGAAVVGWFVGMGFGWDRGYEDAMDSSHWRNR
jgi:hypothetical protein